jgi:hypothetical protein
VAFLEEPFSHQDRTRKIHQLLDAVCETTKLEKIGEKRPVQK